MDEREAMRRWVEIWKLAGPELEAILRKEIETIDVHAELAVLEGAFNYAVHHARPEPTSGLVEMKSGSPSSVNCAFPGSKPACATRPGHATPRFHLASPQ